MGGTMLYLDGDPIQDRYIAYCWDCEKVVTVKWVDEGCLPDHHEWRPECPVDEAHELGKPTQRPPRSPA
jgi:hypothetical protein